MAVELTNRAARNLAEVNIEPNLIVRFEGLDTLYSTVPVTDYIKIGQPNLFIDGTWFIGGFLPIDDNETIIDQNTTTYSIKQQVNHDEGKESSVSTMTIGLIDKDLQVTELISPGVILEDMLGRKVQVFATFGTGSFFDDAVEYFRGFVTNITSGPGLVKLKLNHPDNKKQVSLFKTKTTELTVGINASATTIPVDSTVDFLAEAGPFLTYVQINSEVMRYETKDATNFLTVTRGALGTTAAPHDLDDGVRAFYTLKDNPLDLALQVMMSGFGTDPVYEDVPITSFVQVGSGNDEVANSIFFREKNIPRDFGLRAGDTVTITGATNPGNNVTASTVLSVTKFEDGYYVVLSDTLVLEETTSAVVDFFTQYNTLPDGMRMTPDEVDIDQHIRIRDLFHSAVEFEFYLKEDEVAGKEFIDDQLYKPIACYALNRKASASVNFTVGPIPGVDIKTINIQNTKDPKNLEIVRTTNRSFFNQTFYKWDVPVLGDIEFTTFFSRISQTSKNRIPGTTKTYGVAGQGLRTSLNGQNIAESNSQRVIDRYEFGAEIVKGKSLFGDFASIEIGDIVILEGFDLQVTDITRGDRQFKSRLFEVLNRQLDLKTGNVNFAALDTGLNLDSRFGLMSPCSPIAAVISQQQVIIGPDPTYPSKFGDDEFRKWENVIGPRDPVSVLIRSDADYTITEDAVVTSIVGNTFTFESPVVTTLFDGYFIEFTGYVDTDTSDKQKLIYGYMTDDPNFADGGFPYLMI